MISLARIYFEGGTGLRPDYARARHWARRAAQAGESRGYVYLGQMAMKCLGQPKNPARALAYFRKAVAMGDLKAPRYIGLIAEARGEDKVAAAWFAKGAAQGDITSAYYLGRAYETGAGVPRDYAKALRWYRTAAARGDIIASDGMVGEAGMYEKGEGVPKDMARARALYAKAAATGNKAAKAALARLDG